MPGHDCVRKKLYNWIYYFRLPMSILFFLFLPRILFIDSHAKGCWTRMQSEHVSNTSFWDFEEKFIAKTFQNKRGKPCFSKENSHRLTFQFRCLWEYFIPSFLTISINDRKKKTLKRHI